jgi:hypothetical protein
LCEQYLLLSEVESRRPKGPRPKSLAEVAAGLISRTVPDGDCLIFTGAKAGAGYGQVLARAIYPKPLRAHRVVYAAHHGGIPAGCDVSHLCDRKDCLNVEHLVAEAHAANMARIPEHHRGRPVRFDTEAVAACIAEDGIWQAVVRYGMSYQHALRIRNGWRPKKSGQPTPAA